MNALLKLHQPARVRLMVCVGCYLGFGLVSFGLMPSVAEDGNTFQKPEGALTDEISSGEETPKFAAPQRPTDPLITKGFLQAAKDFGDAKLSTAIERLEKEEQAGKARFFKAYKAKLAKIKSTMVSKKQLSPILESEFERLLSSCDQNQFPQLRVQGTLSFEKHDYAYLDGDYTWHVAKDACEAMGGHLVTLAAPGEAEFVASKFLQRNRKFAWLGGTDEAEEGVWRWVTDEPWTFGAAINNDYGAAHELTWSEGHFNDWLGQHRQAFVCEWETTASRELISLSSEPTLLQTQFKGYLEASMAQRELRHKLYGHVHEAAGRLSKAGILSDLSGFYVKLGFEAPPERLESFKKSQYALFRNGRTWHQAREHCENMGGQLVDLDAPGEVEFVMKIASDNGVSTWLGCSDERQEGQWMGGDGTPSKVNVAISNLNYQNHVGVIEIKSDTPAKIIDMYSGHRFAYICEWD